MKFPNWPLVIGSTLLIMLLVMVLLPELFTARSPYTVNSLRSWMENGRLEFERAPFSPGPEYPIGSDEHGRDIFARIVYGSRLTLSLALLIVLARFALALPLAMGAGFGDAVSRALIKQFSLIFTAVPALLISLVILKQQLFQSLSRSGSVTAFVIVLALVGWARLGSLLLERTEDLLSRDFISTEVAIGKSRRRIALENLLPHLLPEMIVLFFMETARALALIMQLGIFGIFVGNMRLVESSDQGNLRFFSISFEPEWASMLGNARTYLARAPWTVIFPALIFFIAVLAFNLTGEGLRRRFQVDVRGGGGSWIMGFRRIISGTGGPDPRSLLRSPAANVLFFILLFYSGYQISRAAIMGYSYDLRDEITLREQSAEPANRLTAGSPGADWMAQDLREQLDADGFSPLPRNGGSFFMDYDLPVHALIRDYSCSFTPTAASPKGTAYSDAPEPGNSALLIRGRDFSFRSLPAGGGDIRIHSPVLDAREMDLLSIGDYSEFNDSAVLIDGTLFSDEVIRLIERQISSGADPAGFLVMAAPGAPVPRMSTVPAQGNYYSLNISPETGERLAAAAANGPSAPAALQGGSTRSGGELTLQLSYELREGTGRNILGIRPASGPGDPDKAVLFILPYNYSDEGGRRILGFSRALVDSLSGIKSNRALIIAFVDGTLQEDIDGRNTLFSRIFYNAADIELCVDLSGLRGAEIDSLGFNREQAPATRQYAWNFAQLMEDNLKGSGIQTASIPSVYLGGSYMIDGSAASNLAFWGSGIPTVFFRSDSDGGDGPVGPEGSAVTDYPEGSGSLPALPASGIRTDRLARLGRLLLQAYKKNSY